MATKLWAVYFPNGGTNGEYLATVDIHEADQTVRDITRFIAAGKWPAEVGAARVMPWPFSVEEHARALADGNPRSKPVKHNEEG